MKNKVQRKESHNIGTHKEKMEKRKAARKLRLVTHTVRDTSKYLLLVEDKKHRKGGENTLYA